MFQHTPENTLKLDLILARAKMVLCSQKVTFAEPALLLLCKSFKANASTSESKALVILENTP